MRNMIKSMWSPLMNIKPIRNDADLQAAFKRLENVYQAQEGASEFDEMEVLVTLIEAYENKFFPMGVADPVEAIKFRMEQQGLTQKDLEQFIFHPKVKTTGFSRLALAAIMRFLNGGE